MSALSEDASSSDEVIVIFDLSASELFVYNTGLELFVFTGLELMLLFTFKTRFDEPTTNVFIETEFVFLFKLFEIAMLRTGAIRTDVSEGGKEGALLAVDDDASIRGILRLVTTLTLTSFLFLDNLSRSLHFLWHSALERDSSRSRCLEFVT